MSLDAATRLTEILLGLAIIQQSLEHRATGGDPLVFLSRLGFGVLLTAGAARASACVALLVSAAVLLRRFGGPYNGGADRMELLILICLCLAEFAPENGRAAAFGYLAAQVVLSYFVSGWVKVVNPDWRSGRALGDVFQFSAYPVSENLRRLADRPALLRAASWAVMGFELAFPLSLASASSLAAALVAGAAFHLANACLFGLNRFFWIWLTAYPSLIWFQGRLAAGV